MSTEAFGETLQFITNVKLEELEKRSQKYAAHFASVFGDANAHGDEDLVSRLTVLIKGMETWPGTWSSDLNAENVKRWLEQAQKDPGFPRSILLEWIRQAEAQMTHEQTRYDFAKLFGNLLTDWLSSKSPAKAPSEGDDNADAFEKVGRKENSQRALMGAAMSTDDVEAVINRMVRRRKSKLHWQNPDATRLSTDAEEALVS